MKYIIIILALLLTAAPGRAELNDPELLTDLSSFVIGTSFDFNVSDINISTENFEYYVLRKLQKEGIEAVNVAQLKYADIQKPAAIFISFTFHYDTNLNERVYYSIDMDVHRITYIPEFKKIIPVLVYDDHRMGCSHIKNIDNMLKASLDGIFAAFLTNWRSVNKSISTSSGIRFVLPVANTPGQGMTLVDPLGDPGLTSPPVK